MGLAEHSTPAPGRPSRPISTTLKGFARGAAGGLLVAVPLLMTMEMWWHGFVMGPWKMLLLLGLNYFLLIGLEYYSGFEDEGGLIDVVRNATIAYGIAAVVAASMLYLLAVLSAELMSTQELVGKLLLETLAVSIGVVVANSQMGGGKGGKRKRREAGFWGTLVIAAGGAVLFGSNVAPTVEPMLIGLKMSWWHALVLMGLTLGVLHGMVYELDFGGAREPGTEAGLWQQLLRYGMPSYAIALAVAAYLLWSFDRIGPNIGLLESLHMVIALGFVTGLGAAAGKILL